MDKNLFVVIICKHYWDPKNARRFLIDWFILQAWWWPYRVETCSHAC